MRGGGQEQGEPLARTQGRGHAPVFSKLEGPSSQNPPGSSLWFPYSNVHKERSGKVGEASEVGCPARDVFAS